MYDQAIYINPKVADYYYYKGIRILKTRESTLFIIKI